MVSRQRKKVRSTGSSAACRSMNRPIPSQSASSEVERKSTRVFSGGCSASALAIASCATQPVPLSLAPGTTSPASDVRHERRRAGGDHRAKPRQSTAAEQRAPPRPAPGRPPATSAAGWCRSARTPRARSPRRSSVIAGLKKKAVWAASWWAMRTIVRSASGGPSSPSTWWQLLFGSSRRNRRRPGGSSSAISAAAAAPVAAANSRVSGPPASGREAGERAGAGQQADRPPERAVGFRLLLDPHVTHALVAQGSGQPLRSTLLPRREADSRSKAQSSSRRSRIQAASGGVETLVGTSVAIRENYGSSAAVRSRRSYRNLRSGWPPPA